MSMTIVVAGILGAGQAMAILEPHRALYRMSLSQIEGSAGLSGVSGTMFFEFKEDCDAWTTNQKFSIDYVYQEGDVLSMTSDYSSYESKAGDSYVFSVIQKQNGIVDEEIRGRADLSIDGSGTAEYRLPSTQTLTIPKGTHFPTAHMIQLLQAASDGNNTNSVLMFDGTDAGGGAFLISSVIGESVEPTDGRDDLLDRAGWRMTVAVFSDDDLVAVPDYEMTMTLLVNGVVSDLVLDYGDFVIDADLEALESLDGPACD